MYRRASWIRTRTSSATASSATATANNITDLINDGFKNCMPILDNLGEIEYYEQHIKVQSSWG